MLAGALALLFAGCTSFVDPIDEAYRVGGLLVESGGRYTLAANAGFVTAAAAPSSRGGGTRIVFWQAPAPVSGDQQSCATWWSRTDTSGPWVQEGVALRIRTTQGRVRAVTVTKNVWAKAYSTFNMMLWDSSKWGGTRTFPFLQIGQAVLGTVFSPGGRLAPLPWRMCARMVGRRLEFRVWPLTHVEPAWGAPGYSGAAVLPADQSQYLEPGIPGWYVGHLEAGDRVVYAGLATAAI